MDWNRCTKESCQVRYMDSKEVLGCSNPNCGSPRPRCVLCNTRFVKQRHTVCVDCQDGINNLCDNCSKPVLKLFKTHLGEYWCFDCLQYYNDLGPALTVNKLIKERELEKDLEEKDIPFLDLEDCKEIMNRRNRIRKNSFSGAEKFFDNELKRCLGCKFPIPLKDNPKDNNFCEVCLIMMNHHTCVECLEEWDKEVGCDEYGKCINCSDAVRYKSYAYGKTSIEFSTYDGRCTNCDLEYAVEGSALCQSCLLRLKNKTKDES